MQEDGTRIRPTSFTQGTCVQPKGKKGKRRFFSFQGATAPSGLQPLHYHASRSHSVGLLWMSVQLDAETSTWQNSTLIRHRHPRPRQDSNPKSQQASGRRPTPYTARLLCSASGGTAPSLCAGEWSAAGPGGLPQVKELWRRGWVSPRPIWRIWRR